MAPAKQHSIEYRLLVQRSYDDVLKKEGILFLLETSKQFTNFSYSIDVKDSLEGNELRWTLHGLRAPSMNMPETGTAQFSKVYFDLPKTIRFTLIKKEKIASSAEIKTGKRSITSSTAEHNFLRIYTDSSEFDEQRLNDSRAPEYKPDVHRAPGKPQKKTIKKKE